MTVHEHATAFRRFHETTGRHLEAGSAGRHADVSRCEAMRFWATPPHPPDTQSSRTPRAAPTERTPNAQLNPLPTVAAVASGSATGMRAASPDWSGDEEGRERQGGNIDCGDGGDDDGGCSGVDGWRVACASRAQTLVSKRVCADGATRQDVHVWAGEGGRTFACIVVLAVQEDPPSPVLRLGPVRGTGRTARSRAHALSGPPVAAHLTRSRCGWFSRCLRACANPLAAKRTRKRFLIAQGSRGYTALAESCSNRSAAHLALQTAAALDDHTAGQADIRHARRGG